ncbi:hypothetical protein ACW0UW_08100 [[Haemophilus] ducreyi]
MSPTTYTPDLPSDEEDYSTLINMLPPVAPSSTPTEDESTESDNMPTDALHDFSQSLETQYGIAPGVNIQQQRQQRAEANGLTFACVGRQPVDDIWQIYPARKHKLEAYSLALDIAESVGLERYVEHVVNTPVDYAYRMLPLENAVENEMVKMRYDLLMLLQTVDSTSYPSVSITLSFLLDAEKIDDVTLVKLFRLIRLVRYIRQGAHHDNV